MDRCFLHSQAWQSWWLIQMIGKIGVALLDSAISRNAQFPGLKAERASLEGGGMKLPVHAWTSESWFPQLQGWGISFEPRGLIPSGRSFRGHMPEMRMVWGKSGQGQRKSQWVSGCDASLCTLDDIPATQKPEVSTHSPSDQAIKGPSQIRTFSSQAKILKEVAELVQGFGLGRDNVA